jgi:IclR family acetate operon transcriptional repressor
MIVKHAAYDVPGLRAGLDVFSALCESADGLGVAELTARTGANKHMVFRCLKTLVAKGWVAESGEGPKYTATLLPFHVSSMPVSRLDLTTAAEEPLRALWKATGECVYLGVLYDDMLMFLVHRDGVRNVRLGGCVGDLYWPHASAPGKVLLAYGEPALRERCLRRGLKRLTGKTRTEAAPFLADLAGVRRHGYAVDDEEYTVGGRCYAAPVFDATGRAVAAIGTTVLTAHYSRRELVSVLGTQILETARRISRALGYVERRTP